AQVGERQREDRMLDLDRLQEVAEGRHHIFLPSPSPGERDRVRGLIPSLLFPLPPWGRRPGSGGSSRPFCSLSPLGREGQGGGAHPPPCSLPRGGGEGEGEGALHPSPYSRHRWLTRCRISSLIRISSGHGCSTRSSGGRFSVASIPSFPPYRCRSA